MDEFETQTLDLADYLGVLRRNAGLALLTMILVVAAGLAVSFLQTPTYESQAQLTLKPTGPIANAPTSFVFSTQQLETEQRVLTSTAVAERAAGSLGWTGSIEALQGRVDAEIIRDTQILQVSGRSPDPEVAAAITQAFAEAYLDRRREVGLEQAAESAADLERRAEVIREQLETIDDQLDDASGDEAEALARERQALIGDLGSHASRIASLRAVDETNVGAGEIIRTATVPSSPVSPRPARNGALALVLGAMLGVGVAFVRDSLDQSIRTDDQATRATGHPTLGHIPESTKKETAGDRLVTLVAPTSPSAEAYRAIYANLRFMMVDVNQPSMLVTSPEQGEGKTTTAANLAVAAASAGTRTLLVGADLRRPSVHRAFGIGGGFGLSTVLSGEHHIADVITDVGVTNLRLVPGGPVPPNPAELMTSQRMVEAMDRFAEVADLVIYDGPPLLAVADALEVAPRVTGSLLVLDFGGSTRRAASASVGRISGVGGRTLGSVINRIDRSSAYYAYYYYGERPPERIEDDAEAPAAPREESPAEPIETTGEAARQHLTTVEGLGDAKIETLLDHFGSLEAMAAASLDELTAVRGIGAATAERIQRSLNGGPRTRSSGERSQQVRG